MSKKHVKMNLRDAMAAYIKSMYRKPVLDHFLNSSWGVEYLFYPYDGAPDPYACVIGKGGKFEILMDF